VGQNTGVLVAVRTSNLAGPTGPANPIDLFFLGDTLGKSHAVESNCYRPSPGLDLAIRRGYFKLFGGLVRVASEGFGAVLDTGSRYFARDNLAGCGHLDRLVDINILAARSRHNAAHSLAKLVVGDDLDVVGGVGLDTVVERVPISMSGQLGHQGRRRVVGVAVDPELLEIGNGRIVPARPVDPNAGSQLLDGGREG